jgi:hypothetical protein
MTAKTHLPPAVARWLRFERFFNDRRANRRHFVSFREASRTIAAAYRPETSAEWNVDVAYVPARESRVVGPLVSELRRTLGLAIPTGTVPVFIHPQSRHLYRHLIAARGLVRKKSKSCPDSRLRYNHVFPRRVGP